MCHPKTFNRLMWMVFAALLFSTGCAATIHDQTSMFYDRVATPIISKINLDTATRTAQLQGSGALINPKWRTDVDMVFGTGVHMTIISGLDGVAGQIAAASQADNEATPRPTSQPAAKPATSQPATTQSSLGGQIPVRP